MPIEPYQQVQVSQTAAELLTVVTLQVLRVPVEEVFQKIEVLEGFYDGSKYEAYPAGVIAIGKVFRGQTSQDAISFGSA